MARWRPDPGVVPSTGIVAALAALTGSLVLLIGLAVPRGPLPGIALVVGVLGLYGWSAFSGRESEARRKLLARFRESEAQLKTIIDTSPSAVITADDHGVIVGWNRQAERMFGWSSDEAFGRTLAGTVIPRRFHTAHERGMARYRQTGEGRLLGSTIQIPARHRDGHEFPVELSISHGWRTAGKATVVAFVQDVSERKHAEQLRNAQFAVTRPLATAASWAEAAPQVLRGICENLGWDLGEFWTVDGEAGVLRWECAWHRPSRGFEDFEAVARDVSFRPRSGLLGRVWATGRAASIVDVARDAEEPRAAAAARAGLHGEFAFATMNGSTVTGVLVLFSQQHRALDRATLRVMSNLGSQIGQFIERRRAEDALRESGERIRAILDNVVDGIITLDGEGTVQSCNPPAQRLFGYAPDEIIGRHPTVLVDRADQAGFGLHLDRWLRSSGKQPASAPHEMVGRRKDGSTFPLECLLSKVQQVEGGSLTIATLRDISERKAQTEALEYRALHDSLTGLPNRTFLGDRLEQAILAGEREKKPRGLLLMDMDGFKQVNDTLGHPSGDRLLQEVALRLRKALRRADTVARWGGDEFAIVPSGTTDVPRAILIAEKILETLEVPFVVAGQQVEVGASIGIAIYPQHGDDASALMRRADVAMYVAKNARSGYSLYTGEQEGTGRPVALVSKLRSAIEQFELVLHYQPIVDLRTGNPLKAEALVRWGHPKHGLIQPDDFIPAAEQSELIKPLTLWVLNEALSQLHVLHKAGIELGVTVNLSGLTLRDPEFPDATRQLLETWAVPPGQLTFEITERSVLAAAEGEALERLHALGVRVSADDFGTGYSSLAHLKQLALDEIKIDRSFVTDMVVNGDDAAIVRSTIDLAHRLGIRVVGEGVENAQTWEQLLELGCDFVQGFYVSRPIPGTELGSWLRAPKCALPERVESGERLAV